MKAVIQMRCVERHISEERKTFEISFCFPKLHGKVAFVYILFCGTLLIKIKK